MTSPAEDPVAVAQATAMDAYCNPFFRARPAMGSTDLDAIYALRYQVYCVERGFLDPEEYPDGRERDPFDGYSLHFGLYTLDDDLAGTVRLVQGELDELPISQHCDLAPEILDRLRREERLGEMSRLAVSRSVRRRKGDGYYSMQIEPARPTMPRSQIRAEDRRRGSPPFVLHLYREIYQACRRNRIRMLLAAMERPLARLIAGFGFDFEQIGPEIDYYGPVAPFVLDLDRFDRDVAVARPGLLRFLADGLEPSLYPPILHVMQDQQCLTLERLESRNG